MILKSYALYVTVSVGVRVDLVSLESFLGWYRELAGMVIGLGGMLDFYLLLF